MQSLAIQTTNLTKYYGNTCVVNQVNLNVPTHGVYGFLGPNGAGKSTTIKLLLGLAHTNQGQIKILGNAVTPSNRLEILKLTGSLIESPSYYPKLTARENLEVIRRLRSLPKSEIDEVLKIVGLSDQHIQKRPVGKFSLGMKQRLGIAKALMGRPQLLLLDEPTNGLDPQGIQEIRALITRLPQLYDTTVLVSSHLLAEIEQMATHVGIISQGQMRYQGTLDALRAHAKRWLVLRTTNNERSIQLLQHLQPQLHQEWVMVPYLPDSQVPNLWQMLSASNIDILRIEERHERLEDIFLQITKGTHLSSSSFGEQ